jgi:membrane-bound serine protease (ClpP class)
MSWYITLLGCGLFLIGAEIFVPGGVLGIFGAAALIGAAVVGFTVFPLALGWLSLLLILILTVFAIFIWMKYFPKSPIGKALSLSQNITGRSRDQSPWTPGMKGTALSALRPSGKAMIEGRRADVIADGIWIEQNAAIEIIKVEGSRVHVKETKVEGGM